MHTRSVLFGAMALMLVAALAPVATAQTGGNVTVTALENGCPGGRTFCFEHAVDGQLTPGTEISFTFVNAEENQAPHNLYVTLDQDYDEDNAQSDAAEAEGNTEDLPPGEEATFTVMLASNAQQIYYWCDVVGHESLGMWGTIPVESANGGTGDDTPPGDGEEESGSPGPGALALLAAAALGAVALGRRE